METPGFLYSLNVIDLGIIIVYLTLTTLLGAWFRNNQNDIQTYFVGGREVSWFLVLVSIVATETSTVTFLSVPGLAFNPANGNLTFIQLSIGYMIGRVLIALFLLPGYFQGQYISAYEILRKKFDPRVQRSASFLFMLTRTIADGLRLFLTGLLLQQFTGWNLGFSIILMGVVTLVYTYLGGMQAVLWTDFIQFVIYFAGALVAGIILLSLIPDGWNGFLAVANYSNKLQWMDLSFDLKKPYTIWAGVIGGTFFTMASHGADQIMVQRYLCARNLNHARIALVASGLVVSLQFLLFLLIGAGLFVLANSGGWPLPDGIRNDQVFGRFIVEKLPVGVIGLVIAAVLAAAMSTLSSSLNSSASAAVADFYKPIRPGLSDHEYLSVSRFLTILFGFAQISVALIAWQIDSPRSVVDQVLSVAGLTTGMVLGLFILGTINKRVSSSAALAGMLIGFLAVMAVYIPAARGSTIVAWPFYAPVGTLVTVFAAMLINPILKSSPTHQETRDSSGSPGHRT